MKGSLILAGFVCLFDYILSFIHGSKKTLATYVVMFVIIFACSSAFNKLYGEEFEYPVVFEGYYENVIKFAGDIDNELGYALPERERIFLMCQHHRDEGFRELKQAQRILKNLDQYTPDAESLFDAALAAITLLMGKPPPLWAPTVTAIVVFTAKEAWGLKKLKKNFIQLIWNILYSCV